jgi:hypothetical protein
MAEIFNTSVFFQIDGSNLSGTMPSWNGSAPPSTIDDAGRAIQGALTREWAWRSFTLTSTGSANAHALTHLGAPAALGAGQKYSFIAGFANTGATTLNINALGAKNIKKFFSGSLTALSGGELVAGRYYETVYNGTDFVLLTDGTATPDQNSGFYISGGNPVIQFDVGPDDFYYDRAGNSFRWRIAGTDIMSLNTSGLAAPASTSGNIVWAAGGSYSFAHALGTKPKHALVEMVCVVADVGYAINDRLILDSHFGGGNIGAFIQLDAVNVTVRFGTGGITVPNKSTGVMAAVNPGSWQLVITARP